MTKHDFYMLPDHCHCHCLDDLNEEAFEDLLATLDYILPHIHFYDCDYNELYLPTPTSYSNVERIFFILSTDVVLITLDGVACAERELWNNGVISFNAEFDLPDTVGRWQMDIEHSFVGDTAWVKVEY